MPSPDDSAIQSSTQVDDSLEQELTRSFVSPLVFGFFSLLKIGRNAEQLSLHAVNANKKELLQFFFV